MKREPLLKMVGIRKRFLRVEANQGVDFELYRGEICALLGENGAGKTTLMNILFGLYHPDSGKIIIEGKEVEISCPKDAINLGVGMVHQHFKLVPSHQVWENIILGTEKGLVLNKSRACKKIADISEKFGLKINLDAYIWQLSVGAKQKVEIIKALFRGVKILILDEPTAVLTPQETEQLFSTLKCMVKQGLSIIFISHKLKEISSVSDRVVILEQGKAVGNLITKETNSEELARLMMGEGSFQKIKKIRKEKGQEILRVERLSVESDMGIQALKEISFSIYAGEIMGLAGVSGNGQRELAEVLSGTREPTDGSIYFKEKPITSVCPSIVVASGWARIPEDRMGDGIILNLSLRDNFLLEVHSRQEFHKGFFLNYKKAKECTNNLIKKYDIRPPFSDMPVQNLSGGNLQKLILARELFLQPKMLIASQPTRGLDIKAVSYIQTLILEEREKGAGILLISEDLDEIMDLSDRIAVIYEGKILRILPRAEASRSQIGLLMAGVH